MNIDEFVAKLPISITSGNRAPLPDSVIRKMFQLAELGSTDVLYDLNCSDGRAVELAATEFHVRKSVGISSDPGTAGGAAQRLKEVKSVQIIHAEPDSVKFMEATAVLAWFADQKSALRIERKLRKELPKHGRIITIWSPFGLTLPDKIDFPFYVTKKPFRRARSIRDQVELVYGSKCIDFTAAWLLAERFIDGIETVPGEYRRFVTILQSLVIWINAWKMGLTCEKEIPPPVETYMGIMRTFFDVDLSSMLEAR